MKACNRSGFLLALALLLGACGGGSGGGNDGIGTEPPPAVAEPEPPPFGLTEREPLAALALPGASVDSSGNIDVVRAFPGLTFTQPLFLAAVPGDPRLAVVEKGGRMRIFTPASDASSSQVILDLSARVATASEQGLLGLAFDPAFTTNRHFYVHYSLGAGPRRSVIARFTWDADSDSVDPASEKVLLEVEQPFSNHNGGMLAFGPDDFLYIALGDGGSGGDPMDHGQNLGTLLGSLLRIDVHPADPDEPYAIPPDNPFVGTAGARPEIWAYGLRNPWRFSFDRDSGDLWLADVGQNAIEEVNIIVRGGNYGWRVFEGSAAFTDSANTPPGATFEDPVYEYPHSVGRSVTGGYVYRGSRLPALIGAYVFGDFVTGDVWALRRSGDDIDIEHLGAVPSLASFGEDAQGELYAISLNGTLHGFELADPGAGGPMAQTLSATGVFTDLATLSAAAGFIEYDVAVPFWSDGSSKRRWFALPDEATIGFDPTAPWELPIGSILVKHFEISLDDAAAGNRRLETRLLLHRSEGWQGFTYRWDADGQDATLLVGREQESLTVSGADGPLTFDYVFPSRTDCLRCHVPAAGSALSFETRQLNRDFAFALARDNQLRSYDHIGLFTAEIGDVQQYAVYPDLENDAEPLRLRARAYLEVNCASCHRPDGGTNVALDLRFDTALDAMGVIDVTPKGSNLGLEGARIIAPGARQSSVLWERMRRLDGTRMPPLASHRVDTFGVELIGDWIDDL
ncbi:MAG: PQQ-dependent sugar dehydrogenase [Gammaproteobacteria bacterium]|nr:PQQ-dependent sugar dehydrogenase [Gammaproteobacteria bacterium]